MTQDFAAVCRANLTLLFDEFAKATNRTPDGVARQFYGNANFYKDFRQGGRAPDGKLTGRSVSIDRYREIFEALDAAWPEGVPFPKLEPVYFRRQRRTGKKIKRKFSPPSSNTHPNRLPARNHGNRTQTRNNSPGGPRRSDGRPAGATG